MKLLNIVWGVLLFICVNTLAAEKMKYLKDFGAIGNGKIDDSVAIKKAFNSLKNGGTLILGKGSFKFKGLIRIKNLNNCKIDASGSILQNDTHNGGFVFSNCKNFTWTGGTLTYTKLPSKQNTKTEHPLYFRRCTNLRIDGVNINGSPFMGMAINACKYVWVTDCKITNTMRDGLHFVHCQDIVCTGNSISNTVDDALALIDYGADKHIRLKRAIVANNIISNCRQGLVCLGGKDITFANNHVEKTVFSGCQITSNDRFNVHNWKGSTCVKRIKVIGNRFVESGGSFKLSPFLKEDPVPDFLKDKKGRTINTGQVTTGTAAIVVSYIDRKKGWNRDGDKYFTRENIEAVKISPEEIAITGNLVSDFFPGRVVKIIGKKTGEKVLKVKKSTYRDEKTYLNFGKEVNFADDKIALKTSRIISDIEIINNEILNSHVAGIYTNSVYRLRVNGNKIYNCNSDNSKFTQTIVGIHNGAYVDFVNNWIIDDRTDRRHKTPLKITAKKVRKSDNRID